MSPIINTVTTTLSSAGLMKLIIFLFSISLMLSQIENISVISMKGQNNTVILEGATSNRVYYTSDSYNKNK